MVLTSPIIASHIIESAIRLKQALFLNSKLIIEHMEAAGTSSAASWLELKYDVLLFTGPAAQVNFDLDVLASNALLVLSLG